MATNPKTSINAPAIGMVAGLLEQITHEATHAATALAVGKEVTRFNFFANWSRWPGERWPAGDGLVAGSAAMFNILCGAACVYLFYRGFFKQRPSWRLFVMFFGAFSLAAGFGYLMVDPIFYKPGAANLGDWKKIVDLLGGSCSVRAPIAAVGVAGTLFVFLWLPRAALQFGTGSIERKDRVRTAARMILLPYIALCAAVTAMAVFHPLGTRGLLMMVFKYWFGYSAFLWGFFIAAYWLTLKEPLKDTTPLPPRVVQPWIIAAAAMLILSSVLLLPSIRF